MIDLRNTHRDDLLRVAKLARDKIASDQGRASAKALENGMNHRDDIAGYAALCYRHAEETRALLDDVIGELARRNAQPATRDDVRRVCSRGSTWRNIINEVSAGTRNINALLAAMVEDGELTARSVQMWHGWELEYKAV